MPKLGTPVIVVGLVAAGALAGWWLWQRNRATAGPQPTIEILAPPIGTSVASGTRIDFSALAMADGQDISNLIDWSVVQPTGLAGFWETGATTFIVPTFLTTKPLEMQAFIKDPVSGKFASANRSVLVVVTASRALPSPRAAWKPAVLPVVSSFRRSDTGWMVKDRHVLEEPWEFARR